MMKTTNEVTLADFVSLLTRDRDSLPVISLEEFEVVREDASIPYVVQNPALLPWKAAA